MPNPPSAILQDQLAAAEKKLAHLESMQGGLARTIEQTKQEITKLKFALQIAEPPPLSSVANLPAWALAKP